MAESSTPSRGHTSSPSPSASASTHDNKPKKRTRASKPKVRTGCITCKIRRVKCGEEKPACDRCTSTGRTCDGYDNGAPLRNRTPQDSLQEAELKRAEFLRTYQWNESVRSMRPIVADIDGTEMEKKFFHRFRAATEDNFAAHHMSTFTPFWTRLAPRINHHDEAVKHAAIALGAAHQLYQPSDKPAPDGLTPENIEVFIIQQYNKSISKLQRHVGSSSPESIKVTLVCCLAYICLETLRSSHQAVVTHLLNGLKILQSLPEATFDFLSNPTAYAPSPSPRDSTAALDNSPFDMVDIIRIFGKLESSTCFFVTGIRPVVAERGYNHRRFDDGSRETPFANLRDAQSAIISFARDVIARVYEVETQTGAAEAENSHNLSIFWANPTQQRQQACLRERNHRIETLLVSDFLTRPGALPGTGSPNTPEMMCFYVNLLHFRSAQLLLNGIDQNIPTSHIPSSSPQYPPNFSPWQQQQPQTQHPGQSTSTDSLLFDHNLDPRLAAQTLMQMQIKTPDSGYFGSRDQENLSMPTTPNTQNNHPQQNLLPFPFLPFLPFSRPSHHPPPNPNTTSRLHEIMQIAEILHYSPSAKRFRDMLQRSGSNNTPPLPRGGISTQRYSCSFTGDTGLMGPLSLVALVAGRQRAEDGSGNGNEGTGKLRGVALGMLREYLSFGNDDDDDDDNEGEDASSRQFWAEYFGRLGFIERLPLGN